MLVMETTREVAVTGDKSFQIGEGEDARGHFCRWERLFSCIGQLPPALNWAAPSQLGADSPHLPASEGTWG